MFLEQACLDFFERACFFYDNTEIPRTGFLDDSFLGSLVCLSQNDLGQVKCLQKKGCGMCM